jgi:hypothetical protein
MHQSAPPSSARARRRTALYALLLLACPSAGCQLFRGPPPPPLPADRIVEALRERAVAVYTVTDTDISLIISATSEGETERAPTLGGFIAFNARLPGLWLDAEKLTRRVFSLKALRGRFWLALFETREVVTGGAAAYARLPHLVRPEEVRAFFGGPERLGLNWPGATTTVEPDDYRFDVHVAGVLRRQVWVDRRELVVTRIRRYDALRRTVTDVALDRYRDTDRGPFPRRLTVDRPLAGVSVELRLSDPDLSKELPPEVFLPPERPGWRKIDLDRQPLSAVEAFRAEP